MAIPGLRGTDHIGVTVPDIEQAHRFFVDILGCEHVYSLPGIHRDEDWMRVHLDVGPGTEVTDIRFYRCAFGSNFEVFEYRSPGQRLEPPRNSDIGGHHLALYVDDLDAAVDYLRGHGIRVLGEPTVSANASEGQRWVYFLSPWGLQFELVSFPAGKAYEKDARVLLWHPARPEA
ncbi:VOC family protein [Microbacterium sp. SYP-A9085]|uniref:VOC family protein n=1 Tax=Microbacterium sp. SYP-A9085 TaxID=2664454 RepID=UPI00129AF842|nr:VOC family protein [Microbacterium sp. SYP-A9085]MRH29885.1 VOC family protein [Microbacterium sp. SYP-A9085]